MMWQIYALAFLMIAGSLVAVHTRYLLSAVISLAVVGLALSVAFLYLQAPDCAITQIVVEVIALVILIRATGMERDTSEIKGKKEVFTLETVACFGSCALAPVIVINDSVYGLMNASKTRHLLDELRREEALVGSESETGIAEG